MLASITGARRSPNFPGLDPKMTNEGHTTFHRTLSASNNGPPVKEGGAAEHGGLALKGVTAGGNRVFEGGEGGEVLVDQRIVGELPEVFGGLEFGGVEKKKKKGGEKGGK